MGLLMADMLAQSILQSDPLIPFVAEFFGREDLARGVAEATEHRRTPHGQVVVHQFDDWYVANYAAVRNYSTVLPRLDHATHQPGLATSTG